MAKSSSKSIFKSDVSATEDFFSLLVIRRGFSRGVGVESFSSNIFLRASAATRLGIAMAFVSKDSSFEFCSFEDPNSVEALSKIGPNTSSYGLVFL